jgi:hypothetical protein
VVEVVADNGVPEDVEGVEGILEGSVEDVDGVSAKGIRMRVLEGAKEGTEELEKGMATEVGGRVDTKLDEGQVAPFSFSEIGLLSFSSETAVLV